jgi:hypothetical protein
VAKIAFKIVFELKQFSHKIRPTREQAHLSRRHVRARYTKADMRAIVDQVPSQPSPESGLDCFV